MSFSLHDPNLVFLTNASLLWHDVHMIRLIPLYWDFSYFNVVFYVQLVWSWMFPLQSNTLPKHLFPGCIGLFYGNKTASQFLSFTSVVHMPGDLSENILLYFHKHLLYDIFQSLIYEACFKCLFFFFLFFWQWLLLHFKCSQVQ